MFYYTVIRVATWAQAGTAVLLGEAGAGGLPTAEDIQTSVHMLATGWPMRLHAT